MLASENISKTSVLFASLIALNSSYPYFAWSRGIIFYLLFVVFILIRAILFKKNISSLNKPALFFCFVLSIYLYLWHGTQLTTNLLNFIIKTLPLIFVILLKHEEKKLFITYTTNIYSFILLFSLIYFFIWSLGIHLPSSTIEYPNNDFYTPFTNYYLFIINNDLGIFTRFQSIFTEPGHIGMIVAFLLYVNYYNFHKWQCWVLLITLIWSFSLAAYVLFFIGVILYKISSRKTFIASIFKTFIFLIVLFFIANFIYRNYPDTVVSKLIFSRLVYDDEKGISGNNRNEDFFMKYYNEFVKKPEYITGIDSNKISKLSLLEGNSSYKVFIFRYGLIGITLLALFYVSIVVPTKSNIYWGLFILYCFSFYQRPYALWEIESFLFICFIGQIKCNKHNILAKDQSM